MMMMMLACVTLYYTTTILLLLGYVCIYCIVVRSTCGIKKQYKVKPTLGKNKKNRILLLLLLLLVLLFIGYKGIHTVN